MLYLVNHKWKEETKRKQKEKQKTTLKNYKLKKQNTQIFKLY